MNWTLIVIIVRLHLLLVPPQKPDFELSNSDEIFFFFLFSITPLSDFEMGSEQYGSLSGALKKKKTNANGC